MDAIIGHMSAMDRKMFIGIFTPDSALWMWCLYGQHVCNVILILKANTLCSLAAMIWECVLSMSPLAEAAMSQPGFCGLVFVFSPRSPS